MLFAFLHLCATEGEFLDEDITDIGLPTASKDLLGIEPDDIIPYFITDLNQFLQTTAGPEGVCMYVSLLLEDPSKTLGAKTGELHTTICHTESGLPIETAIEYLTHVFQCVIQNTDQLLNFNVDPATGKLQMHYPNRRAGLATPLYQSLHEIASTGSPLIQNLIQILEGVLGKEFFCGNLPLFHTAIHRGSEQNLKTKGVTNVSLSLKGINVNFITPLGNLDSAYHITDGRFTVTPKFENKASLTPAVYSVDSVVAQFNKNASDSLAMVRLQEMGFAPDQRFSLESFRISKTASLRDISRWDYSRKIIVAIQIIRNILATVDPKDREEDALLLCQHIQEKLHQLQQIEFYAGLIAIAETEGEDISPKKALNGARTIRKNIKPSFDPVAELFGAESAERQQRAYLLIWLQNLQDQLNGRPSMTEILPQTMRTTMEKNMPAVATPRNPLGTRPLNVRGKTS